jgi:hypothetical protein
MGLALRLGFGFSRANDLELLTRIGTTESGLLCMPTKRRPRFWNWKGRFVSIY